MFTFPISKWEGGIFYEHGHRLLASFIGALTVILCVWVWIKDSRLSVRLLALGAVVMVMAQGILGGLTVIYQLPPAISAAHGVMGQTFFCLTIGIAYLLSREWQDSRVKSYQSSPSIVWWAGSACAVIYIQLIIGAVMRHTFSGLAIPDFPTMGGTLLPAFDASMVEKVNAMRAEIFLAPIGIFNILVHFAHRVGALLVVGVVVGLFVKVYRERNSSEVRVVRAVQLLAIATALQATLGILTVLMVRHPVTTSLHVVIGAAVLGTSFLVFLRTCSASARIRVS